MKANTMTQELQNQIDQLKELFAAAPKAKWDFEVDSQDLGNPLTIIETEGLNGHMYYSANYYDMDKQIAIARLTCALHNRVLPLIEMVEAELIAQHTLSQATQTKEVAV